MNKQDLEQTPSIESKSLSSIIWRSLVGRYVLIPYHSADITAKLTVVKSGSMQPVCLLRIDDCANWERYEELAIDAHALMTFLWRNNVRPNLDTAETSN